MTPALFWTGGAEDDSDRGLDLKGLIVKVIAQEVIGFALAFALSLAVSITAVELVWQLI